MVGCFGSQLLGSPVEQSDPLVPQQFHCLPLGFLPGRDRLLDQSAALGRQAKRLGTGVLFQHDLQPPVRLQRFDVAAEGGRVKLQNLADLGGPGEAKFGGDDQDV